VNTGGSPSPPLVVPIFLPNAGCRHRCTFCNQRTITGESGSLPGPTQIRKIIDDFLKHSRPRSSAEIAFFGGTFLGLPEETVRGLLEQAARFVLEGRADGIRFSTRPDTVDQRRMRWIRPFPVNTVELGVQSLDDRVLAGCLRGHTAADAAIAVSRLRSMGCRIGLQLMIGLPGQDRKSVLETARKAVDLGPDFVRIYPTLVLEDSPLADLYRSGRFDPLTLEAAVGQAAALYRMFEQNRIAVVRMGLQETAALRARGRIVAGPYHPAFGELARSAALYTQVESAIERIGVSGGQVKIVIHPTRESQLRGPQNRNLQNLKERFGLSAAAAEKDAGLDRHWLRVETGGKKQPVRIY
jgi:histone acetyltransferase (RNA polymerase elongator complex component)